MHNSFRGSAVGSVDDIYLYQICIDTLITVCHTFQRFVVNFCPCVCRSVCVCVCVCGCVCLSIRLPAFDRMMDLQAANSREQQVWNPVKRAATQWILIEKLGRYFGRNDICGFCVLS